MKQVKFFWKEHQHELEKAVNEFIKNKNVISVSYSTNTRGYSVYHNCCIVYSVCEGGESDA